MHPSVTQHLVEFMERALDQSLDRFRGRFPHISVEIANVDRHGHFIPAIAELLRREEVRGTKGMSSGAAQNPDDVHGHIAWEMQNARAVLVREGDELFGYATLGPWEVPEGRVIEFCSAVVDEDFRGLGLGRVLVDAREILAVSQYLPDGYQPIAFCNQNSARIYNRDLWVQAPWDWYSRYPVPVVCNPECQVSPHHCDCLVLVMDVRRLAEFSGLPAAAIEV